MAVWIMGGFFFDESWQYFNNKHSQLQTIHHYAIIHVLLSYFDTFIMTIKSYIKSVINKNGNELPFLAH